MTFGPDSHRSLTPDIISPRIQPFGELITPSVTQLSPSSQAIHNSSSNKKFRSQSTYSYKGLLESNFPKNKIKGVPTSSSKKESQQRPLEIEDLMMMDNNNFMRLYSNKSDKN